MSLVREVDLLLWLDGAPFSSIEMPGCNNLAPRVLIDLRHQLITVDVYGGNLGTRFHLALVHYFESFFIIVLDAFEYVCWGDNNSSIDIQL